jgi:hypothetical protein
MNAIEMTLYPEEAHEYLGLYYKNTCGKDDEEEHKQNHGDDKEDEMGIFMAFEWLAEVKIRLVLPKSHLDF